MAGGKNFVGFGLGPIQSGLFVYEARASGNFGRVVVAEVDSALVRAVRAGGGTCTINVAGMDGIDRKRVEGVEVLDPTEPADRARLLEAVADADELATCLPSVRFFDSGGPASVAGLLAEGFARRRGGRPALLYAAENHNHAAELLREAVERRLSTPALGGRDRFTLANVQFLNTVIGKMSGVITDAGTIARLGLAAIAPGIGRAVLVEEFNRILISRVALAGARRGIEVFQEKDDLLPFEEAKLYGHNAVHAMIAYLADLRGHETIASAGRDAWIMDLARAAFLEESGPALVRRHAKLGDPLFTEAGWRDYALDLLERMVNPHLHDLVCRVGRDHARKLARDDRLFGTMRLALEQGVEPRRLALGAAAGVLSMIRRRDELPAPPRALPGSPSDLTAESLRAILLELWAGKADAHAEKMIAMTWEAARELLSLPARRGPLARE